MQNIIKKTNKNRIKFKVNNKNKKTYFDKLLILLY